MKGAAVARERRSRRDIVLGVLFLAVGLLIAIVLALRTDGMLSTFALAS